ncbi:SDR family oxidoreductase [Luteibacter sp. ME-Dv--P-043b]|uniref:SDR family oxidoreductase n=1 Tax=Luteibacter sp. ME-Dv--P-043b TaxID=3040291 RepID=UPI002555E04D|nr:SDR family oxidoreductase [Luteibacter sp. ME-Dv--P-043b]
MDIKGNTILITGGGSGIGRALAEAFHARGNQVVIAGRRQAALDETTAANPGMASALLDIEAPSSIGQFAERLTREHPALNVVIHNAGIMRPEDIKDGATDAAEATIATNLLGPIRLNAALIGHLLAQPKATVMTVSSGLAFTPLSLTPTYCATKAAIHSYSNSLRYQLRNSNVQVMELVPPYVQTELMGERQKSDPNAMPLDVFITEVMGLIESQPDAHEILVERVKPLRFAEASGNFEAFFQQFNDQMARHAP